MKSLLFPSLFYKETLDIKSVSGVEEFSYFSKPVQNTVPIRTTNIQEVHQLVTSDLFAQPTRVLRCLSDKDQARNYKARNFDYVCFSGVFSNRSEKGLIRHSKLLTLDFDHVDNPPKLKRLLIDNPYFDSRFIFISPSGDGLKWIIRIDLNKYSHLANFQAIQAYVKANYKLDIDKSGKDVSRCCFLAYDANAYINPDYKN